MDTDIKTKKYLDSSFVADHQCVTVIINPVSGKGNLDERKKEISDSLSRHGYQCQFISTSQEITAKSLAEEALDKGVDLLVVAGGDGTVMEVLAAVADRGAAGNGTIPVAVVPFGTGNLLSVNLGVPPKVPDAIDVALSGKPYTLDLVKTSLGRYFAIMGGMGLDAHMVDDADRGVKDKFGAFAYVWGVLKNLSIQPIRVNVVLDHKTTLRRRVKSVVIANMGKIAGDIEAMPTAQPDDGLLDIGFIKARTLWEWMKLAALAVVGQAHRSRQLEIHRAKHIAVNSQYPELLEMDGESMGRETHWEAEVIPKAVSIMLPTDAPAVRDTERPASITQRPHYWPAYLTGALIAMYLVKRFRHKR